MSASLGLLDSRGRHRLLLATAIQAATSLLDLVGVMLLGLVGALAVTSVEGQPPPEALDRAINALGIPTQNSEQMLVVLAAAAGALLLGKSIFSAVLLRRVFLFLAGQQAQVSSRLVRELLARPLTYVQKRSSQATSFALIQGAGAATLQLLGQGVILISEAALLLLLAIALLIVNPVVAAGSIAFFVVVAMVLQYSLGNVAASAGVEVANADINSLDSIQEAIGAYREITVSNRRALYVERIQQLRWQAAQAVSSLQFIASLTKYVFEVALVIGGFALALILFTTEDTVSAVGTLALFLAAATRVMPSILRMQGAALSARSAAGSAQSTFNLAASLRITTGPPVRDTEHVESESEFGPRSGHDGFAATIEARNVSYTYPGGSTPALRNVSLTVPTGTTAALVGRSGAGKSTLADVLLGILEPDVGTVTIGGVPAEATLVQWPGAIAYVPQEVTLANSTIRSNVALGLPESAIDDERVSEALKRARLSDVVEALDEGTHTIVGERGFRLSGGQRQRLGIARALYSRPRLLVLDEATSALDAQTELAIGKMLSELEGSVTVIIIAHRLSTVREVDQAIYLEDGACLATGTFEQLRKLVPAFDQQAHAMGLRD